MNVSGGILGASMVCSEFSYLGGIFYSNILGTILLAVAVISR